MYDRENESVEDSHTLQEIKAIWQNVRESLRLLQFPSDNEEIKYFAEFVNAAATCNVVTLGVGFTIETERNIQRYYPQCSFLGLDTEEENRLFYESLSASKFVASGISANKTEKTGYFLQSELVFGLLFGRSRNLLLIL